RLCQRSSSAKNGRQVHRNVVVKPRRTDRHLLEIDTPLPTYRHQIEVTAYATLLRSTHYQL
ncbi:hypothetical protein GBAR_LOCUS28105, partial [Geodia barretti]